jgi:hypothetical protein
MLVPALVQRTDTFRWTSRFLHRSSSGVTNESPNSNAT